MRNTFAGRFDRQPGCRWWSFDWLTAATSGDQTCPVLWKILDRSVLLSVRNCHIKKFRVMFMKVFESESFLWYLSAPACKSKVEQRNQIPPACKDMIASFAALLPVPITLYTSHFPEVDGLWLRGRSWHYLYSQSAALCSVCSHRLSLGVQIFPRAHFHLLLWRSRDCQDDDMWAEQVNE